jgi:drug/metabolite transporter (DMT)-like permease
LALIGVSATGVTWLRAMGLTQLSGSLYVVVSSTDVAFNTLLSRFMLRQQFTTAHYVSAAVSMLALTLASLGNTAAGSSSTVSNSELASGVAAAVGSSLLSAFNAVLSELALKRLLGGAPKPKATVVSVSEVSLMNALVPFILLFIWVCIPGSEASNWPSTFGKAGRSAPERLLCSLLSCRADRVSQEGHTTWLALLTLGLALGKMVDRFSKFLTISRTSAFFFVIADTARRILTAIVSTVVFAEPFNFLVLLGLLCMAVSLALYALGVQQLSRAGQEARFERLKEVMLEQTSPDDAGVGTTWTAEAHIGALEPVDASAQEMAAIAGAVAGEDAHG